jgi:hypothetical protein
MVEVSGEAAWALCRCCAGVLLCEGHVAGDPTKKALEAVDVVSIWPTSHWRCDTCEDLRRFEEKRALLAAPPRRIGEVVQ